MGDDMQAERAISRLYDILVVTDFAALRQHIPSLFAAIHQHWHDCNPIPRYECFYASAFFSHLAPLRLGLAPEGGAHGKLVTGCFLSGA